MPSDLLGSFRRGPGTIRSHLISCDSVTPSCLRSLIITIVITKQTNQHKQPTAQRLLDSFLSLILDPLQADENRMQP
jgi:hypothetical protein